MKKNSNDFLGMRLFKALEDRDHDLAKRLLKLGANPNVEMKIDYGTMRPIQFSNGHEMALVLMDYGADIDYSYVESEEFNYFNTFIHGMMAIRKRGEPYEEEFEERMMEKTKYTSPEHINDAPGAEGITLAACAAYSGRKKVYKQLLQKGAVLNEKDIVYLTGSIRMLHGKNHTFYHIPESTAQMGLVRALKDNPDADLKSALDSAVRNKNVLAVRTLVSFGADVNRVDIDEVPFRIDVFSGLKPDAKPVFYNEILLALLDYGFDIKKHSKTISYNLAMFTLIEEYDLDFALKAADFFVECGVDTKCMLKETDEVIKTYGGFKPPVSKDDMQKSKALKTLRHHICKLTNPKQMSLFE